jgi:TolB-like protein
LAEVFISYARANEDVARRVANGLKASGFDPWWDDQLPAHRAYSDIIEQRLRGAAAVVVLWSKDAAQSQWVRAEADFARNERKLVQAQLDGTLPPLPFNQIQCADLTSWRGNRKHRGWTKLVDGVSAVISGVPLQQAEPAVLSTRPRISRRGALGAVAMILLLAALAVFFLPGMFGTGENASPRVAVLPFESVGESDRGLVEGMWEDTRHALSRNPQLLVLGPNTSRELAEKGSEAARKAADYLVEASVRTATNRVRISTSLVRSKDGAQIWSQTFDRKLDDVFALQSEIAQEIEGKIRGRLARGGGVKPENIATSGEVYALYSDARAKIRNREVPRYREALDQLQRVVAMDPNFAPGWATLAVAATFETVSPLPRSNKENEEQRKAALEKDNRADLPEIYARRAIALAPNLAAGHAALGFALNNRGPVAQAALRRAVALDPNDIEALHWLANSMDKPEQTSERLKLYSRVVEIEPLWWPAILNKLGILLNAKDYAAAERERQRLEQLGSTALAGMVGVAIQNEKGDLSEAARIGIKTFNSVGPTERGILGYELAFLLLKLGYFDEVQANFDPPASAPYFWRNDPRGLDILEDQNLPARQFFTMSPLSDAASRVFVTSGRGAQLAELYRQVGSTPAEFQALVGEPELVIQAPTIALALRQSGDNAAADSLLSTALSLLNKLVQESGVSKLPTAEDQAIIARIYAAQGRLPEAIGRLALAVEQGWIPDVPVYPTDLLMDPVFALLKNEPGFEKARQRILNSVKRERIELGPFRLAGSPTKSLP